MDINLIINILASIWFPLIYCMFLYFICNKFLTAVSTLTSVVGLMLYKCDKPEEVEPGGGYDDEDIS